MPLTDQEKIYKLEEGDRFLIDHANTANWADKFGEFINQTVRFERKPRTLSLFSGAGGLDIGFHDAGFDLVETVEFESAFSASLSENTGTGRYFDVPVQNVCLDIREYECHLTDIDLIIGGPPCQSFSAAGARASGVAGVRDNRGRLFEEYVRLLDQLKPKAFVFENVYRIIGSNKGNDWQEICTAFRNVGYTLKYRILSAADYGVPQFRERLIIVGVRLDLSESIDYLFPRPTHGPDGYLGIPHVSAALVLADLDASNSVTGIGGRYGHLLDAIPEGLNYSFFTERLGHPSPQFAWRSKFSDFLYKADPNRPVRTIKAQGGKYTGPFHWSSRPFRIDELKRLQTFPDSYHLVGGRGSTVKQIGNSVPPQFSRIIALSVAQQVFNAYVPLSLPLLGDTDTLDFRKSKRQLTAYYEKKAKDENRKQSGVTPVATTKSYFACLRDNLQWQEVSKEVANFSIEERFTESILDIFASPSINAGEAWQIKITPTKGWSLDFDYIQLKSDSGDLKSFAALWKSLEHFLARNQLKADLVQLSNYYQYDPAIKIHVAYDGTDTVGRVLCNVAAGACVGMAMTMDQVAEGLDIPSSETLAILIAMKEVGYEIRSSKTNSSIPEGEILIPYPFPTLSRHSVQRLKRLT